MGRMVSASRIQVPSGFKTVKSNEVVILVAVYVLCALAYLAGMWAGYEDGRRLNNGPGRKGDCSAYCKQV